MAKEIALTKITKISQAQQYMLFATLGAAVTLGVAISLVMHFVNKISFNAKVIAEQDKAIVAYSKTIQGIGICEKPKGEVYTDDELRECIPDAIDVSSIPGTLRANILEGMASNAALNSVPKDNTTSCVNPTTNKSYTYSEMTALYDAATTSEQLVAASRLIRTCSALRVIPDALPAFKNEEALLSSLNKIFIISGWQPEFLSPNGNSANQTQTLDADLGALSVSLSIDADTATTMRFLDNVERSIREFDISRATIKIGGDSSLVLEAQATAFYTTPSSIVERTQTISSGGKK